MKNKNIMKSLAIFSIVITMFLLTGNVLALSKPDIITLEAEEINPDTALLQGELLELGGDTQVTVFFQYREGNVGEWKNTTLQNQSSLSIFQRRIENLKPNTYYEYRARGYNSNKDSIGAIREFTTERESNIFQIDIQNTLSIIAVISLVLIITFSIIVNFYPLASICSVILGFMFLYSKVNILIGTITILFGIWLAFFERGKN
ncbi:MAG: fibronectin type III domain-containing protein [Atribacterota bacterium]